MGFCECMVEFFVSLSLNQFLVGFAWEKMWLGFHMVLKEHALRFVDCGDVKFMED